VSYAVTVPRGSSPILTVLLLKSRSPVSEYNFSCQFSVASYQFIERIWARREALYFCVG